MNRLRILVLFVTASLMMSLATPASAAPAGSADTSYGHDGQVTFDVPGFEFPTAMAVLPNGSVAIALATDRELVVVRATSSGSVDASFGVNGTVRPVPGKLAGAPAIFSTHDGGLLIVAWVGQEIGGVVTHPRLVLVKLRANGARDTSFGRGTGLVFVARNVVKPLADVVLAAAMTSDGVVVAGLRGVPLGYFGFPAVTGVIKFAANGSVDRSFGAGGFAPLEAAAFPGTFHVAVDSQDRVLVGTTDATLGPTIQTLRVLRLTPKGRPDVSFGIAGVRPFTMGGDWNFITALVVDQRDRAVVAGFVGDGITGSVRKALTEAPEPYFGFTPTIVRLTARGRLDASFSDDGVVSVHRDQLGRELIFSDALAIDAQSRPIFNAVAGRSLSLIRLTGAGNVDSTFDQPTLPIDSWIQLGVHGVRVLAAGYHEEDRSAKKYRTVLAAYRN